MAPTASLWLQKMSYLLLLTVERLERASSRRNQEDLEHLPGSGGCQANPCMPSKEIPSLERDQVIATPQWCPQYYEALRCGGDALCT